jgi:hypothetical protein
VEIEKMKQGPTLVAYVAESQTFPSIDLSIAIIHREKSEATLYHSSVSIDAKHFATSLRSKAGHLPLDMALVDMSGALLRSERSKVQVAKYKNTVVAHRFLKGLNVTHYYAVFDDNADDLLKPTTTFVKQYWILSTEPPTNPRKRTK